MKDRRPQLDGLMDAARKRQVDILSFGSWTASEGA